MGRNHFYKKREKYLEERKKKKVEFNIINELQETHFIVPADNFALVEKAINVGCHRSLEILDKYSIQMNELCQALDTVPSVVENILANNYYPELVLIDGEDATILNKDNILRARKNAIDSLNARTNFVSQIYYRPSGIELEFCIDDICEVIENTNVLNGTSLLNGIIYPKVESPDEIGIIIELLEYLEKNRGLKKNSIKLQFLIESACGAESIREIAEVCKERLTGIIFGMADYASELGISSLNESHPMFLYVKNKIINYSAVHHICAIDCMSFNYPVPDKKMSMLENKNKILNSMKHLHDIYINSIEMGMHGKWVGHPLQLLAAKIASEKIYNETVLSNLKEKLKAYSESSTGAAVIQGAMADRATDRSAKAFLRRAVLKKKMDLHEAFDLRIINQMEFEILQTAN